jgi:hypothetical protein
MENYIVRIYRRDANDPHKVAGVFESVEQETENTFTNLNSLVSLLASDGDAADAIDTARTAERETLTD